MHGAHQVAQRFSKTGVPRKWASVMSWLSASLKVTAGTVVGDGCQFNFWRAAGGCCDWLKLLVGLDWVNQKATIAAIDMDRSPRSAVFCILAQ